MKIRSRIDKRTAVGFIEAPIVLVLSISYFSYVFQLPHGTFLTFGLGDWVDPYFTNAGYLLHSDDPNPLWRRAGDGRRVEQASVRNRLDGDGLLDEAESCNRSTK